MLRKDLIGAVAVLEQAKGIGLLGPGPVEVHIEHTERFVAAVDSDSGHMLDLGSGGGVPGLILALVWPTSSWVLLDASERRTTFLDRAVTDLGLTDRVSVVRGRAEELGRSNLRGTFDVVTSRGFGPPSVTAECGAPFLREGGRLVVSEPPEAGDRWPASGLDVLGLERLSSELVYMAILEQARECPERYPRRVGIPEKRPLF